MSAPAPARIPFVDLQAQYRSIAPEVQAAVGGVLDSAQFILGPEVEAFETEFAAFCRVPYAVGVSSGLEALSLALRGLGVGPGDDVVVPASTFIATALAVSAVGARPVLADCDPATGNLDAERLAKALTAKTRAVIPVHLGGQPVDMDPILDLARARYFFVVEDAAQAHGALYKGRPVGGLGDAAAFSFYPGKNLGAYGDGGAVTTSDGVLAERIRRLRNYGQREKYHHAEKGTNARLDSVQAAVLRVKLKRLASWNAQRAEVAALYREALESGVGDLDLQKPLDGAPSVHHLFWVETDKRDALQAHLKAAGIDTVIHYPVPVHLQEAYKDLGLGPGAFPNAERRAQRTLSLPMYAELSPEQIARVTGAVRGFFGAK